MIFATIFFVGAHSCIKFLKHLPLHEVIFARLIFSFILCLVYFKYKKINALKEMTLPLFWRGFFGATAMVLFFYTLQVLPLATAITLNYLTPLFALTAAIFVLNEHPSSKVWLCVALAFIGVLLTKGFDDSVPWPAFVAAIVASMLAGLAYTFVRKAGQRSNPFLVIFALPLVGVVPSALAFWSFDYVKPSNEDLMILLLMATLVFIAQYFMTRAYTIGKMSQVSIITYLTIVWSILVGYFVFSESIAGSKLIGVLFIAGALVLNEFFVFKAKKLEAQKTMIRPQCLGRKQMN